jgi:DNA invertase Pin-like site-specific DNA recombinase
MSNVTIYLRRSVVDDDHPGAVSYDQQLNRCRELAKQHGSGEPDVLVDWGKSGGEGLEHRRSAYQQLKDGMAAGAIRWVVSYDLSRLSRSTKETLELVDHARKHGARVHVGDLGILDPDDPTGKFTLTTLSSANTLLREMASKRAREHVLERQAAGLPIGRPPYGSRPGESVSTVLDAYRETGSYHAAARKLNAAGIKTRAGAEWYGKTVQNVVQRAEPPALTSRRRVRSRGRYILTGMPVCPCGRSMMVVNTAWGVKLLCGGGKIDASHPRPIEVAESKVLPWVMAEAARLRVPESVEVEVSADEAKRVALDARRQRVVDTFVDGLIDKMGRDRRLAAIDMELASLDTKAAVLMVPKLDWTWSPEAVNGVLRALWRSIQLGPDMLPVSADWWVPEWRA